MSQSSNTSKLPLIFILLLLVGAGTYFFIQQKPNPPAKPSAQKEEVPTTDSSKPAPEATPTQSASFDIEAWKTQYLAKKENAKQWDKDFCQGFAKWFDPKMADQYFVTWGPLGIRTLMNDPSWGPEGLVNILRPWERKNMDGFQKTWPKPLVDANGKLIVPSFSVKHVIPGSPADGHLQQGDILLTLNGKSFPLANDARGDAKPWNFQEKRSLALGAGMLMDQAEAKGEITFTLLRIPKEKMNQLPAAPSGFKVVQKDGSLQLPEALKPYLKTVHFDSCFNMGQRYFYF